MSNMRKDRLAGLTGFVSYMKRDDAQYALKESDGIVWGGSAIKTGWGKAMPKPLRPSYSEHTILSLHGEVLLKLPLCSHAESIAKITSTLAFALAEGCSRRQGEIKFASRRLP
mgnify:FL=1